MIAVVCCTGCSETNKTDNASGSADTAVLKEDPGNTLNASPVNDTTVKH